MYDANIVIIKIASTKLMQVFTWTISEILWPYGSFCTKGESIARHLTRLDWQRVYTS